MKHRNRNGIKRCVLAVIAAASLLGLAGCGSGSSQATQLLRQTFSRTHRVASGNLAVVLTVRPAGASGLGGPLTLSLTGPFQNLGSGRLPASAFNIGLSAMGKSAAVTLTSTGSTGYVTFEGQSYKLPQATFERLESSFAQLSSPPGQSESGALGRLGIQPLHWLVNPQIVGDEGLDGVDTAHIRAGIDVAALLSDLNRFLQRAASQGVPGASSFPGGISAATRRQIASEVKNPTVNVWTGVADKTLRGLEVDLTVPVSGELSALLGRSAGIDLTMQYSGLNQAQTITAPRQLQPYSQFEDKLRVLIQDFEGSLISGGGASGGGGAGGATSGSGSVPSYQAYANCIQSAAGNLRKMQRCAPLLNGG